MGAPYWWTNTEATSFGASEMQLYRRAQRMHLLRLLAAQMD